MKVKIKSNTLVIFLLCFLFTAVPYLSQTVSNIIFLIIEVILILILVNMGLNKSVIKRNYPIIIFGTLMLCSTFINLGFSTRTLNAFVTGMKYIVIFITICQITLDSGFENVASSLLKFILFATTLEDIAVLVTRGHGLTNDGILAYYFLGNKFGVSYLHLFSLSLLLLNHYFKKGKAIKKPFFWFYLFYSLFLCKIADCNTGIVGCLVIGLIVFIVGKKEIIASIINNGLVYLLVFIGASFLLIGTNLILGNKIIYSFLMNYSHTSKILSGRIDMYNIALKAISNKLIWGYGINNTIVEDTLSWGNAQNGLLKMLLDYGVIGTFSFLFVCLNAIGRKKLKFMNLRIFSVITFLYAMAICSTVEINISGYYFAGLAIVKAANLNITSTS